MWFTYQPTEDGRIVPCRVADNGEQIPIPGAAVSADPLSVTLKAHPSGKHLYASTRLDLDRDGWNTSSPNPRPPVREKSFVRVYGIAADGRLTLCQSLPVRGILGQSLIYPDGKRLFAELPQNNYLLFTIRPDGTLSAPRPFSDFPTFYLEGGAGVYDNVDLALAPNGKTGYLSRSWGLLDTSGASLQPLRVAPDGSLKFEGAAWEIRDDKTGPKKVQEDVGPVIYSPDGKTIVVQGRSGSLWHCPTDAAGRIQEEKAVQYPVPEKRGNRLSPFFRRQRSGAWRLYGLQHDIKGFSVYHLPAPGRAIKTATFGTEERSGGLSTPDGHILYETFSLFDVKRGRYTGSNMTASFLLDDRGRVTPSAPFRRLNALNAESIVFIKR